LTQYLKIAISARKSLKLNQLIYKSGKTCKNNEWKENKIVDLSSMPSRNIVINNFSDGNLFNTNIKIIDENTLLYGSIRPYFRKCGFTTGINYIAGTVHSFKTIEKKYYYWILALISSHDFHEHCNIKSQGTKMPIINWSNFTEYDVPIPEDDDLKKFNLKIEPLYNQIKNMMVQNRKLLEIKQLYLKKFFG